MRKTAGFTLIELVIVIVILGILGAVAAPRFMNLQGDAYAANLNSMKSSIQTSMTMANAKAILGGNMGNNDTVEDFTYNDGADNIRFDYGYPAAGTAGEEWKNGIIGTLQDFDINRFIVASSNDAGVLSLTITPVSIDKDTCKLTYVEAEDVNTPATVSVDVSDC